MEAIEAIILAGGLGTRLRGVIGADTPKCMAPVVGKPFLHYLLSYAVRQGIERIVLSLGHKSDVVLGWLRKQQYPARIDWVVEPEPLGTGGGIQLALRTCMANDVFVLNGDTMFDIPLRGGLLQRHLQVDAEVTIALKEFRDFERYGTVERDTSGRITAFQEKAPRAEGFINGGVYCIRRTVFLQRSFPEKFSFEKDFLERFVGEGKFCAYEGSGYFIDIGVPEDFERAQHDFQRLFSPA